MRFKTPARPFEEGGEEGFVISVMDHNQLMLTWPRDSTYMVLAPWAVRHLIDALTERYDEMIRITSAVAVEEALVPGADKV